MWACGTMSAAAAAIPICGMSPATMSSTDGSWKCVWDLPRIGALYDPELKGLSAEAIYDRLVTDLRRSRKLMTLRGYGLGDIIGKAKDCIMSDGVTLDEFCWCSLAQGLEYHIAQGRGYLPAD